MSGVAAEGGERVVCTGCPLLCDDIVLRAEGTDAAGPQPFFEHACAAGEAWLAQASACQPAAAAVVDGEPVDAAEAILQAATRLAACRRVLVTGCQDATLETVAAAASLAEQLGAAFDAGAAEAAISSGPLAARLGRVTADFEELRDRADCVLLWHADPSQTHPRFIERFIEPAPATGRRRVFVVGAEVAEAAARGWTSVAIPQSQAAEAAVSLQLMLATQAPSRAAESTCELPPSRHGLGAAVAEIAAACRAAACVGVVTSSGAEDASGLAAAAVSRLVAALAHTKPAFEIPLAASPRGAGPATAAAVCTWRFGAAGAVALANRDGGLLAPAEADACRLIDRRDVDGVVVVGEPPAAVTAALAGFDGLVVALSGPAPAPRGLQIWIDTAPTAVASNGQLLRDDGRLVALHAVRPTARPAAAAVIEAIRGHLSDEELR